MKGREPFEPWAKTNGYSCARDGDEYICRTTKDALAGWNAAIELSAEIAFDADTNWDAQHVILTLKEPR